ncbi:MAG: DUF1761 domain-containing protein [Candidatus Chromulinivorax sp.]
MAHHFIVVLAGGAAHFFSGWFLNSNLVLGKIWKEEKEKNKDAKCVLSKDMRINIAAQIVASVALSIATCIAISIFEKSQMPIASKNLLEQIAGLFFGQAQNSKNMMSAIHAVLFIWAGFILPISAEEVIWCNHNWKHWILERSANLISLIAIAATVTFLS